MQALPHRDSEAISPDAVKWVGWSPVRRKTTLRPPVGKPGEGKITSDVKPFLGRARINLALNYRNCKAKKLQNEAYYRQD